MNAKVVAFAMLGAAIGASACERITSVGAAGRGPDADVSDGASAADADGATVGAAELCTSSGGGITTGSCCANGAVSFPDTCLVGACSCSPASSRTIAVCDCSLGCFSSGFGCVGPQGVCTEGIDVSCNQDTTATAPRGRCVTGGRCLCTQGATLSSAGNCL